jgi:hypothetical protein
LNRILQANFNRRQGYSWVQGGGGKGGGKFQEWVMGWDFPRIAFIPLLGFLVFFLMYPGVRCKIEQAILQG